MTPPNEEQIRAAREMVRKVWPCTAEPCEVCDGRARDLAAYESEQLRAAREEIERLRLALEQIANHARERHFIVGMKPISNMTAAALESPQASELCQSNAPLVGHETAETGRHVSHAEKKAT